MKVNLYLTFDGNCAEAFDFYKTVFHSNIDMKMTWAENPEKMESKTELSEEDGKKIMHMSLPLTKETILMGCDSPPDGQSCGSGDKFTIGNNVQINLVPDSKEHAETLLKDLSAEGGKVIFPMSNTFWGSYFGMCKDRFGLTWMCDFPLDGDAMKKTEEHK